MPTTLIPQPQHFRTLAGTLELTPQTTVTYPPELAGGAQIISHQIRSGTGWELPKVDDGVITFTYDPTYGEEEYGLRIGERIEITASTPTGAFYGGQTLRQLFPAHIYSRAGVMPAVQIPALEVRDSPRLAYRGVMVDVARHFLPKPDLLRLIDAIAAVKINRLHLHLTDDQGWRVEIRRYPRLTQVGAHRSKSSRGDWRWEEYEHTPHGGFFTQDDIREIVAFAQARGVEILPEIDVPGHSQAAIAAYPHLARLEEPVPVWTRWGINHLVLDPREETLEFFRHVMDEVMELFPGKHIGLGGDEVPFTQWRADPTLHEWALAQGLNGVDDVHAWFVAQLANHVHAAGRTPFVWDELAGADLPQGTLVHAWRTDDVIDRAAQVGQQVVVCTEKDLYFDYTQSDHPSEPVPVGKVTTVQDVAEYQVPQNPAIIGVQGNLWSEHLTTPQRLEYAAFPRVLALADMAWREPTPKQWSELEPKLPAALQRLEAAGVTYRPLSGPHPWQQRPGVRGRMHGEDFVAGHVEH